MSQTQPSAERVSDALVIFGGTGDLALRMLYPALYYLHLDKFLPEAFRIIGVARGEMASDAFIAEVETAVRRHAGNTFDEAAWTAFRQRLDYARADATDGASFKALTGKLAGASDVLFYLSTSPSLYGAICTHLQAAGLATGGNRVMVEKPLGRDLASCRAINDALTAVFPEHRVLRVDHYLGKETVQNLIALRFANRLFEPLWNSVHIDYVQITVAETVGVEGRWAYYNDYGALRDMVQNHLLQLLCLVAMEPPQTVDGELLRNEKIKILRSLRPLSGRDLESRTVRGQYAPGIVGGETVHGYTEEQDGATSGTETFTAIRADIDNWRWAGTPFYLRTGKRMAERRSEIVIQFRDIPHCAFACGDIMANRLVITLQPKEEISMLMMNKMPGISEGPMSLRRLPLSLSLSEAFKSERPRQRIAYERLLVDAMHGNTHHFVHRDETEAAWTWVDGILEGWDRMGHALQPYAAGSWGPSGAMALVERNGHHWNE